MARQAQLGPHTSYVGGASGELPLRNASNVSTVQPPQPEQINASKARRSLRNGFIALVLAGALVVGLLLAVPGLKGVAPRCRT
jgi:hypothetical protein